MKVVFKFGGPCPLMQPRHWIELHQADDKSKLFNLYYGLEVKYRLTYNKACFELGAAILHFLCCEGLASNEGR